MRDETQRLVERWIMTFLEPPPLADPELLALVLAEHEATQRSKEPS